MLSHKCVEHKTIRNAIQSKADQKMSACPSESILFRLSRSKDKKHCAEKLSSRTDITRKDATLPMKNVRDGHNGGIVRENKAHFLERQANFNGNYRSYETPPHSRHAREEISSVKRKNFARHHRSRSSDDSKNSVSVYNFEAGQTSEGGKQSDSSKYSTLSESSVQSGKRHSSDVSNRSQRAQSTRSLASSRSTGDEENFVRERPKNKYNSRGKDETDFRKNKTYARASSFARNWNKASVSASSGESGTTFIMPAEYSIANACDWSTSTFIIESVGSKTINIIEKYPKQKLYSTHSQLKVKNIKDQEVHARQSSGPVSSCKPLTNSKKIATSTRRDDITSTRERRASQARPVTTEASTGRSTKKYKKPAARQCQSTDSRNDNIFRLKSERKVSYLEITRDPTVVVENELHDNCEYVFFNDRLKFKHGCCKKGARPNHNFPAPVKKSTVKANGGSAIPVSQVQMATQTSYLMMKNSSMKEYNVKRFGSSRSSLNAHVRQRRCPSRRSKHSVKEDGTASSRTGEKIWHAPTDERERVAVPESSESEGSSVLREGTSSSSDWSTMSPVKECRTRKSKRGQNIDHSRKETIQARIKCQLERPPLTWDKGSMSNRDERTREGAYQSKERPPVKIDSAKRYGNNLSKGANLRKTVSTRNKKTEAPKIKLKDTTLVSERDDDSNKTSLLAGQSAKGTTSGLHIEPSGQAGRKSNRGSSESTEYYSDNLQYEAKEKRHGGHFLVKEMDVKDDVNRRLRPREMVFVTGHVGVRSQTAIECGRSSSLKDDNKQRLQPNKKINLVVRSKDDFLVKKRVCRFRKHFPLQYRTREKIVEHSMGGPSSQASIVSRGSTFTESIFNSKQGAIESVRSDTCTANKFKGATKNSIGFNTNEDEIENIIFNDKTNRVRVEKRLPHQEKIEHTGRLSTGQGYYDSARKKEEENEDTRRDDQSGSRQNPAKSGNDERSVFPPGKKDLLRKNLESCNEGERRQENEQDSFREGRQGEFEDPPTKEADGMISCAEPPSPADTSCRKGILKLAHDLNGEITEGSEQIPRKKPYFEEPELQKIVSNTSESMESTDDFRSNPKLKSTSRNHESQATIKIKIEGANRGRSEEKLSAENKYAVSSSTSGEGSDYKENSKTEVSAYYQTETSTLDKARQWNGRDMLLDQTETSTLDQERQWNGRDMLPDYMEGSKSAHGKSLLEKCGVSPNEKVPLEKPLERKKYDFSTPNIKQNPETSETKKQLSKLTSQRGSKKHIGKLEARMDSVSTFPESSSACSAECEYRSKEIQLSRSRQMLAKVHGKILNGKIPTSQLHPRASEHSVRFCEIPRRTSISTSRSESSCKEESGSTIRKLDVDKMSRKLSEKIRKGGEKNRIIILLKKELSELQQTSTTKLTSSSGKKKSSKVKESTKIRETITATPKSKVPENISHSLDSETREESRKNKEIWQYKKLIIGKGKSKQIKSKKHKEEIKSTISLSHHEGNATKRQRKSLSKKHGIDVASKNTMQDTHAKHKQTYSSRKLFELEERSSLTASDKEESVEEVIALREKRLKGSMGKESGLQLIPPKIKLKRQSANIKELQISGHKKERICVNEIITSNKVDSKDNQRSTKKKLGKRSEPPGRTSETNTFEHNQNTRLKSESKTARLSTTEGVTTHKEQSRQGVKRSKHLQDDGERKTFVVNKEGKEKKVRREKRVNQDDGEESKHKFEPRDQSFIDLTKRRLRKSARNGNKLHQERSKETDGLQIKNKDKDVKDVDPRLTHTVERKPILKGVTSKGIGRNMDEHEYFEEASRCKDRHKINKSLSNPPKRVPFEDKVDSTATLNSEGILGELKSEDKATTRWPCEHHVMKHKHKESERESYKQKLNRTEPKKRGGRNSRERKNKNNDKETMMPRRGHGKNSKDPGRDSCSSTLRYRASKEPDLGTRDKRIPQFESKECLEWQNMKPKELFRASNLHEEYNYLEFSREYRGKKYAERNLAGSRRESRKDPNRKYKEEKERKTKQKVEPYMNYYSKTPEPRERRKGKSKYTNINDNEAKAVAQVCRNTEESMRGKQKESNNVSNFQRPFRIVIEAESLERTKSELGRNPKEKTPKKQDQYGRLETKFDHEYFQGFQKEKRFTIVNYHQSAPSRTQSYTRISRCEAVPSAKYNLLNPTRKTLMQIKKDVKEALKKKNLEDELAKKNRPVPREFTFVERSRRLIRPFYTSGAVTQEV